MTAEPAASANPVAERASIAAGDAPIAIAAPANPTAATYAKENEMFVPAARGAAP